MCLHSWCLYRAGGRWTVRVSTGCLGWWGTDLDIVHTVLLSSDVMLPSSYIPTLCRGHSSPGYQQTSCHNKVSWKCPGWRNCENIHCVSIYILHIWPLLNVNFRIIIKYMTCLMAVQRWQRKFSNISNLSLRLWQDDKSRGSGQITRSCTLTSFHR